VSLCVLVLAPFGRHGSWLATSRLESDLLGPSWRPTSWPQTSSRSRRARFTVEQRRQRRRADAPRPTHLDGVKTLFFDESDDGGSGQLREAADLVERERTSITGWKW